MVVRSVDDDRTIVEALDPQIMISVTGNDELNGVADEAAQRLRLAIESIGGSSTSE